MSKVVVTGGCGFIGSNLVEELIKLGFEVVVLDNLTTGKIENIKGLKCKVVIADIRDLKALRDIFVDTECVFHQAALPSVARSIKDPVLTNDVNITGTLNVLIASRDCEVEKVIYASSSSVYGDTPTLPKREDMKPNPKSPYAVSKLAGEYYCRVFSEVYGLKTVCLRYFNVYGPKQDPYSEYSAVVPRFICRIIKGKPPIIFGDGNQTRDFTFVEDVVKANILAMKKNVEGIFNIATGKRVSIKNLAEMIMEIVGAKLKPIYDKPRPGDIRHSLADISLTMKKLGYKPEYDLRKGLEVTIRWFSMNLKKS